MKPTRAHLALELTKMVSNNSGVSMPSKLFNPLFQPRVSSRRRADKTHRTTSVSESKLDTDAGEIKEDDSSRGEAMPASSKQNKLPPRPDWATSIQNARKLYDALLDIGVDKRCAIFELFLRADEPAMVDTEEISLRYCLGPKVALTLLNYILTDPRVRVELREMGFADEELPDWVPKD